MAKVQWARGIDFVSGLLSARPKAGQPHSSHASALLATHRTAPTQNPDCTRIYMVGEYLRTTEPSSNEMAARERFTVVAGMVKARAKDLSKLSADQAAFAAQKNDPEGKKTMKAYYWMICGAEYDAQQG